VGSKKNPIWRVVVADRRSPRDGRFIEAIGHYNPQTQPSTIVIDHERLDHWLALGAEPTNTVKKLMRAKDNPQAEAEPEAPVAVVEEATEAKAEAEAEAPADVAGATEPDVTADAAEGESGEQPA
jgi:small subunit ribosomal protein S16